MIVNYQLLTRLLLPYRVFYITITTVTKRCVSVGNDQSSGRDNRHISDNSSSQLLSQSDILGMRGCGIAGEVRSLLY